MVDPPGCWVLLRKSDLELSLACAVILSVADVIDLVSFSSSFWAVTVQTEQSPLSFNLGLWTLCFRHNGTCSEPTNFHEIKDFIVVAEALRSSGLILTLLSTASVIASLAFHKRPFLQLHMTTIHSIQLALCLTAAVISSAGVVYFGSEIQFQRISVDCLRFSFAVSWAFVLAGVSAGLSLVASFVKTVDILSSESCRSKSKPFRSKTLETLRVLRYSLSFPGSFRERNEIATQNDFSQKPNTEKTNDSCV